VNVAGGEDGKIARRQREQLSLGVEEDRVLLGIVRPSNAQSVAQRYVADPLLSRCDELDVDVLAVRFPNDIGERFRPVALHDGEHPLAVQFVPSDGHLRKIGATQVVERRRDVRPQRIVQPRILKTIQNHR
jgi:hypothetical protein